MEVLKVRFRKELRDFRLEVDLEVPEGVHVLFGHSGVGKTQTLECIAGLSRPDEGLITLSGKVMFQAVAGKPALNVSPRDRSVGYVFQDGALFPHRTLFENVFYPLRKKGIEDRDKVDVLLNEMGLGNLKDRYPETVSGGQRRRAAIARAVAAEPNALLLDEPFVHLDRVVRARLIDDLLKTVGDRCVPTLLVTHDLDVAAQMARTISVMEEGRVIQTGSREEVLFGPASGAVARLFGDVNILEGCILGESGGVWNVETDGLVWRVPFIGALQKGQSVEVFVRAGGVKILKENVEVPAELQLNVFSAMLERVDRRPDFVWTRFSLNPNVALTALIPADTFKRSSVNEGERCRLSVTREGISLVPTPSS